MVAAVKIFDALKGIGGQFEVQRILGAFGSIVYIVSAPAFIWAGKITATLDTFCVVYPAGLGVCIGATAGAIALKDRQVAQAKVTERTVPGTPQPVEVVNQPDNPVPVEQGI